MLLFIGVIMKEIKKNIRDGLIILSLGILLIILFIILLIFKADEKTISDIMIAGFIGQTLIFIGLIKIIINNNKKKKLKEE